MFNMNMGTLCDISIYLKGGGGGAGTGLQPTVRERHCLVTNKDTILWLFYLS